MSGSVRRPPPPRARAPRPYVEQAIDRQRLVGRDATIALVAALVGATAGWLVATRDARREAREVARGRPALAVVTDADQPWRFAHAAFVTRCVDGEPVGLDVEVRGLPADREYQWDYDRAITGSSTVTLEGVADPDRVRVTSSDGVHLLRATFRFRGGAPGASWRPTLRAWPPPSAPAVDAPLHTVITAPRDLSDC